MTQREMELIAGIVAFMICPYVFCIASWARWEKDWQHWKCRDVMAHHYDQRQRKKIFWLL